MRSVSDSEAEDDDRQATRALMRGGLLLLGALMVAAVGGVLTMTFQSWGLALLITIPVLGLFALGVASVLTGVVLMISSQGQHS